METTYYLQIEAGADAGWADTVEFGLFSQIGIKDVAINEALRTVAVTVDGQLLSGAELVAAVNGFEPGALAARLLDAAPAAAAAKAAAAAAPNAGLAAMRHQLALQEQQPQQPQLKDFGSFDDFDDFASWDALDETPAPAADSDPIDLITQTVSAALPPPAVSPISSSLSPDAVAVVIPPLQEAAQTETALLEIEGMTCAACVNTIESNVIKVDGIESIKVSLLAQRAEIIFTPSIIQKSALPDLIEDMGFGAVLLKQEVKGSTTLQIYGMTCASCSGTITQEVSKMEGMISVSINLLGNTGAFTFDKNVIGVRDIVDKIEDLGFDAHVQDGGTNSQLESLNRTREIQHWRNSFWKAFMFALPVSIVSMFLPKAWVNVPIFPGLYLGIVAQFILTIPVQFGVGGRFYTAAFKAIKHKSYTMDVLIALGTSIAFFFSSYTMLRSFFLASREVPEVFFETSSSLITFVTLGRYLENLAKGKTSNALSKLMSLAPSHAVLLVVDKATGATSERKIATELIQPGDLIKIVPGERIAADGTVVFGSTSVDESLVTGEAKPVSKKPNDNVIAGTINGTGMIHMRATRVGTDTTLSQILKLVSDAQTSKAPIQDLADQVASVFVPSIIFLGLLTFVFWFMVFMCSDFLPPGYTGDKFYLSVKLGICVIVVACPCALGLATPTAVMVGTGVGAQLGILIKGGGPLSVANRVTKVVFDKTGTLTQGKMGVVNHKQIKDTGIAMVDDLGTSQFLSMVGAVEEASEHAIGKSLFKYCKATVKSSSFGIALHEFESVPGNGVRAIVSNTMSVQYRLCIGNASFLLGEGCSVPKSEIVAVKAQETLGLTVVLVAIEKQFCGTFALSDVLKPESKAAVAALRKLGLEVCMITGDQELTAQAIAEQCGISEVHAGVSPAGKKTLVENMQLEGDVVAMVGDGVNDSASIAQADVGIAVFGGTDVAIEAASIVLMKDDMMQIVTALDLCRTIYQRIRLNFVWATGYNLLMVPLAMGFGLPWGMFLHPMVAGMAMSLSSVSVVVSSLLLRMYRRPKVGGLDDDDEEEDGVANGTSNGAARLLESLNFDDEVNKASDGKGGLFSVGGLLQRFRAFTSGRSYAQLDNNPV